MKETNTVSYLVLGYVNDYDGTEFWPVATFTAQADAIEFMTKCQEWADQKRAALQQEFQPNGEPMYRLPNEVLDRYITTYDSIEGRAAMQQASPYDSNVVIDLWAHFPTRYCCYELHHDPQSKTTANRVVSDVTAQHT